MSFGEKKSWVYALVTAVVYLGYVGLVIGRADGGAVVEVTYGWVVLGAVAVTIVLTVAGGILVAITSAAGGERHFRPDERDRAIERHGERVGYAVFSTAIVVVLVMTIAELRHFWIGNAIYLSGVLATLAGTGARILAYRRGIPS